MWSQRPEPRLAGGAVTNPEVVSLPIMTSQRTHLQRTTLKKKKNVLKKRGLSKNKMEQVNKCSL